MKACPFVAALLVLGMAAPASASSAAVLPTASEANVAPSLAEALQKEVNHWLVAHDWEVVPAKAAGAAPEACSTPECGHRAAMNAGADVAVQLRLFRHPSHVSFVIAFYENLEAAYVGGAEGDATDLPALVEQAMKLIAEQRERGPGPWLEVTGSPVDAAVRVDGRVVGALPCTVRVASGLHVVIVEHPGYKSFNTTISVGDFSGAYRLVEASLAASNMDETSASFFVRPSALDWTIGGTLAAVGIGVGALGLVHHAADGDCASYQEGTCVAEHSVGPRVRTELVMGVAAIVAGASLLVWAPFARYDHSAQVALTATPHDARLVWRGRF